MTRQRDYAGYLRDMLDYATKAEQFVAGMSYEQFVADHRTQFAILWAIGVIGEAASKLPATIRNQYPAVPWRAIISMRNRLIHGYESIIMRLVWNVVQVELPMLKPQIQQMLADIAQDEQP